MANIFAEKGSLSDVCAMILDDVSDTLKNQSSFLNQLTSAEVDNTGFSGRFFLNDTQYFLQKAGNEQVYRIYVQDPSGQSVEPVAVIDEVNELNTYGPWNSLDDLEAAVSDASDCTYLMQKLTSIVDNTDATATGVSTQLSAAVAGWISNAGPCAKEAYSNIIDTLHSSGDTPISGLMWLQEQYNAIASAQANNTTGEFTFSSTNYHVQGFAGSYMLTVIFETATAVLSVVVAAVSKIAGVLLYVLGQLGKTLLGLIPNASDTYVVEKDATNNIFAVPVFQDTINSETAELYLRSIPVNVTDVDSLYDLLVRDKVATLRIPGYVWSFYRMNDGTIQYEMFLSLDFGKYVPSIYSVKRHRADDDANAYKDLNPNILAYAMYFFMDGTGYPDDHDYGDLAHGITPQKFAEFLNYYSRNTMYSSSSASFQRDVELELPSTADPMSPDDSIKYYDKLCRSNVYIALTLFMNLMCYVAYGGQGDTGWYNPTSDPSMPNSGATSEDWCQYLNMKVLMTTDSQYLDGLTELENIFSWETIVNKILPRIRKTWAGSLRPLEALATLCTALDSYYETDQYVLGFGGTLIAKKYHFYPPKYGTNARALTIAIVATAAVAVTAVMVTKTALKVTQRKKQITRYANVQNAYKAVEQDPNNKEKIKAYRKAVRSYNRWASICGTSRLSSISGWELGDAGDAINSPTSLSGVYNQYKTSVASDNRQADSYSSLILSKLCG